MNATELKIEKSAKTAEIILKISKVFTCIVAAALILLLATYGAIYAIGGPAEFANTINVSEFIPDITGTTFPATASETMAILVNFVVTSLFYCGFIFATLLTAEKFFRETRKAHTPFIRENAKRIRIIAGLILCLSFIPMIIDMAFSLILGLPMVVIFTLSLEGLIISLIIFSIGILFEHGCDLQTEADATL